INGVQASVPANGRLIARIDAETAIESESPPALAAIRPSPSFRRNQNSPRPARIGFRMISARIPPPQPNTHDEAITGSESHPLWGSAANQVPDISNGFHSGRWPSAIARPSRHERGSQKDRMSGCWSDRLGRNAMPRNANRTDPTMTVGPAAAFRSRRAVESVGG